MGKGVFYQFAVYCLTICIFVINGCSDSNSEPTGSGETESGTEDDGTGDGGTFYNDTSGEQTGGEDTGESPDTETESEEVDTAGCGNSFIDVGEVCDDGNGESGDGCSAGCDVVEQDYVCLTPGEECISTVECGDSKVSGSETCDDGNLRNNDGCSKKCELEKGWICPIPGEKCRAAKCGDGIIAGIEQCDDGNAKAADGCSNQCKLEDGWACDAPGKSCHKTVCNDGVKEGSEPCDDGNDIIGDGCSPYCEVEPDCSKGACTSSCGDGLMLPSDAEECDDGNTLDGDGCSSRCKIEIGFDCQEISDKLPGTLTVPVTLRDFIAFPTGKSKQHPDFQSFCCGLVQGIVKNNLGSDGKPIYNGPINLTSNKANFDQWYRDVPGVNVKKIISMNLDKQPNGSYYYKPASYFPLDNDGFVAKGLEVHAQNHNFGFTSEIRTWFEYKGNESLLFSGDDDVWVFINRKLVVDLGGVHGATSGSVTLNKAKATELGLKSGNVYEIVLFHAERHTGASNFNLTLNGFVGASSDCQSNCGDGIVAGDETCDDGVNDGSWGSCTKQCTQGPYCGDGKVDTAHEECDDGVNLTSYSFTGKPGCAPGCKLGAFCGDGKLDSRFGEECDDGANTGGYGECTSQCRLDVRCGDGKLQAEEGESCDDGNTVSGDGCSFVCEDEDIVL